MKVVKIWGFILSVIIILLLPGCEEDSGKRQYTIGFSQCMTNDAWRQAMERAMRRELAFHPNIHLQIKDANSSNEQQIQDIKAFINQQVDVLVVSPNEAKPITPVVEQAYQQGIPVIIVDRRTTSPLYTAYVGANNTDIGKIAAEYATKLMGKEGRVFEIWGRPGSSPARNRHKGFTSALGNSFTIIDSLNGRWGEEPHLKEQILSRASSLRQAELVFAHNDVMAFAAYKALEQLEIRNRVKLIGVDGLAGPGNGLQLVEDGILDATLLYPTGGDKVIELAASLLSGKQIPKENILPTTVINPENVRIIQGQVNQILAQQKDIERQNQKINTQLQVYQSQQALISFLLASLVVVIALGAYILYSLREKQRINLQLKVRNAEISKQRNEIERIAREAQEATQAKFQFFTNISHEFRTPLTLILGPLDDLIRRGKGELFRKDLTLIKRNTLRLLRLINQLMDFRKLENQKMLVKAAELDLVSFTKDVFVAFEPLAEKKSIDYQLITPNREIKAWFDQDKLDKVLFNLVSNAFKFTRDGGYIHVRLTENDQSVYIEVSDNGRGMSEDHVEHAFDRFYQGEQYHTLGSGLGLSLSKELIELHRGTISVRSQKKIGTTFTIKLRQGHDHFSEEELATSASSRFSTEEHFALYQPDLEEVPDPDVPELTGSDRQVVLVIEDNRELNAFLCNQLRKKYQVIQAFNGNDGLNVAFRKIPDLIICDVMLPGNDGLTITRQLKHTHSTEHIPVIVLTARSNDEQLTEGIRAGADAYLTKPFNLVHLESQIVRLLENRKRLQEHYSEQPVNNLQKEAKLSANDQFVIDFRQHIRDQLHNPALQVNDIAESLGLSRVQLYRKVKALMGNSVNDLIVQARLEKAEKLLKEPGNTISDVAYAVGFSSPAYFSTAFKAHFHCSPSEYRQQLV
jgi:signal transduction histidine kinase/DNA-binding response OmpR family regulator